MQKFYLIFIFLYVTCITNAQTKEYSLERCNELLTSNNISECIIECEKVLFYSNIPSEHKQALFIKGNVLKNQKDYRKAADVFSQIKINSPKDSLFYSKTYEISLCYYLVGQYNEAINNIKQWEIYNPNKITLDLLVLKTLCMNSLFDFSNAKNELGSYFENQGINSEVRERFDELYKKRKLPKKRNPELAENLSMILPGLGQCYSSRWGEGAVSFLLNAGALSFGIYHIYYKYYFTGYVVGFTLLNKFHSGGKRRAYILAETKNKKSISRFNEKLVTLYEELVKH